MRKAFRILTSNSINVRDIEAMIKKTSVFSRRGQDTLLIQLRPERRHEMIQLLRSNRTKESGFRFSAFLHKITRKKKFIMGMISKRMCQQKAASGCVPRFTNRAYLVVQEDSQSPRTWLTYHETMTDPTYFGHLTLEQQQTVKNVCRGLKALHF